MIKPNGDLVWMDDTIQLSTGPAPEPPVAVLNLLPSPAIAELDDPTDGLEIVILSPIEAGDGRVYVYKGNGDRTQIFTASGQFEASPAVADINNDGNIDIVVSSWDTIIEYPTPNPVTYIYALHGKNGSLIWEEMRDTTFVNETGITLENSVATPAIADLNKDGVKDVIVAITPEVFALDGTDGDNLWQPYMLPNRIIWSSPALGDIDHDSFIDIAIAGATISQEVVDLVIPDPEEDITFSNDTLTEGVPVKISAIIHNKGNTDADEVVVNFYENNSFFAQVTIDVVPAGGTWEALVDWTPAAGGLRELKVELDPNNTISEVNENNNIAICYVKVNIPYPDFELRELKFYRADGVEVYVDDENGKHLIEGEPSTITAICYNKGDKDGTNVNLTFYVDGIMLGEPINIESFPRGQKRECSTTWVATIGYHDVNSWIDPNNNIREHNETNNWILVSQLYVKSRDPQGAPYIIEGKVYSPNGTSVIGATVTITNNETRESLTNFTDSSGYFKFDLNSFPSRYMEGDEILLYATDGINEYDNYANPIYAYSEDIGTYIDIQLKERPVYTFTVELDTQVKNIDPGSTAYYTMLVTNLGNRENAINFTVGLPLDTSTNTVATGWTARVLPSSIFLELNETVEVTLMVESSPDSPAYLEVRVDVTCSSFYDPGEVHHLFTITTINLKYQLALSTATISKQIDPRDTSLVVFEFKLTNLGNKRDKVTITHEGLEQKWSAEYPHTLTVEPSATVKFQFKITIDPDAGAGEYLVQVIASSEDGITTDKCTIFIEVIRPDLAITDADLQWEPAVPKVGQLITIYAKVSNIGKANATGVKVTIKVDLLELSVTPSTVDIAPHKSKDVRATWRPDSEGTYQIAVIIDKDNEIMEAIENNNEISKNISFYPDLVIDTKYIHLSNWHPQEQEKVTVTVELRNDGTADVIKSFKVIFYLGDPGDKHIIATIKITEVIEMDDYIEVTTEWTATHAGTYEIYVWADAENVIQELVEGNNVASVNITVRTRERADTYRDVGVSQELLAIGIIIIVAVIAVIVILYYPSKKKRRRGAAGVPRRKPKHKRVEEEKQILKEGAKKPKQAEPLEPVEVEPIIEEE
jgi:subtilase family serine protease